MSHRYYVWASVVCLVFVTAVEWLGLCQLKRVLGPGGHFFLPLGGYPNMEEWWMLVVSLPWVLGAVLLRRRMAQSPRLAWLYTLSTLLAIVIVLLAKLCLPYGGEVL